MLPAHDGSGGEAGVLLQVLWRHKGELEVRLVLDEDTADEVGLLFRGAVLLLFVCGARYRRCDGRELADDFGDLIGAERNANFFAIGGREDFDGIFSLCVESEEFGFEAIHVTFLAMD